jgi:hypothetical protein
LSFFSDFYGKQFANSSIQWKASRRNLSNTADQKEAIGHIYKVDAAHFINPYNLVLHLH